MEFLFEQLLLLFVSVIANGLSALAGGGAGLLQLPALLFLGLAFSTALGTHKIASVALGVGATIRHIREKRLDFRFAGYILAAGLPGVVLGANVILAIPDHIARFVLGVVTLGLGLYSRFSPSLGMSSEVKNRNTAGWIIGAAVLFFIGFLNGSITSGTGLFVTLWLVVWFGLDYQRAVAYTLILVGLFWNGIGAVTLALQTPVQWSWLPALIVGALVGGYLGAHWSIAKGSQLVKRMFEIVTVCVGLSLIVDGLV
ncbi:TSUP family permease [Oleiphilus messinensis]|uniref:Probable membrane transporter protein n=1 Tax=Oleiphilus messinensis TaxID=141451 RepID=A0A1Y0I5B1_9GAMM|nr:sulfite exporter TauE/SafE family protein [Oleiphilus messinensis]ARU55430.1 TSUP family permease [Oleiphilus messinensis]